MIAEARVESLEWTDLARAGPPNKHVTWIISLVCQPFIVHSISSNRYENELNEGYVYIACDLDYKFSLSTVCSLYFIV